MSDVLFRTPRTDWLTERTLPTLPLRTLDLTKTTLAPPAIDDPMPILYARPDRPGSLIEVDDAGLRLGVDIFGGAFLLLTRYEELALDERDEHGRFPARSLTCGARGLPPASACQRVCRAALVRALVVVAPTSP